MTDPLRSDRHPVAGEVPDRDRQARIEELLLAGLNHYFADQYDLAINVWTRVLFLDRGHAKARAYIERARSAMAERLRRGDELLHTGSDALDRGDAGAARELVTSAVEHGAASDQALALLARIERLETATGPAPGVQTKTDPSRAIGSPDAQSSRRWRWIGAGVAAGVVLSAGALVLLDGRDVGIWPLMSPQSASSPANLGAPLPVPTAAEVALSRAEVLHARGRLHDALAALKAIPPGDPLRARADEISAIVQKQLLTAGGSGAAVSVEPASRQP